MSTEQIDKRLTKILSSTKQSQFVEMFDLLADTLFWIKDLESRIVHANSAFIEHMGLTSLHQILGKTDLAFAPVHLAKQFLNDDISVIAGNSITDRIELNIDDNHDLAWFVTSKRPLYDINNTIIGSYGVTHSLEKSSALLSMVEPIRVPVEHIRQNFNQEITIDELAKLSHLSISALERRFKKYLGKTPKAFITQVRLEKAQRMLIETTLSVSDICELVGFSDKSYFSKQFKLLFGVQPSLMRKQMAESKLAS